MRMGSKTQLKNKGNRAFLSVGNGKEGEWSIYISKYRSINACLCNRDNICSRFGVPMVREGLCIVRSALLAYILELFEYILNCLKHNI